MAKLQQAYLNTLWWGVCIGGRHYEGTLKHSKDGKREDVQMIRHMSLRDAKAYAAEQGITGGKRWQVERDTHKWETLASLEMFATKWCEDNLGDDWILYGSDSGCLSPKPIIACKGWIRKHADELGVIYEEFDEVGNHCDDDKWNEIHDKWDAIIPKDIS